MKLICINSIKIILYKLFITPKVKCQHVFLRTSLKCTILFVRHNTIIVITFYIIIINIIKKNLILLTIDTRAYIDLRSS